MGYFVPFLVECRGCWNRSRPDRNVKESIRKVLAGEFKVCNNCGRDLIEIQVPNRKAVQEVLKSLGGVLPEHVIIVDYIGGKYPARGIV